MRLGAAAAVLALLALTLNFGDVVAATPGSSSRVLLETTASTRIGDTIVATLRIAGVSRVGGYEAQLRFDPTLARVVDVSVPGGLRHTWGRPAHSLGPIERADGVVFGAYSCPVDCRRANGPQQDGALNGSAVLAKVTLETLSPGRLEIALGSVKVVDIAGRSIAPANVGGISQIQVGGVSRSLGAVPSGTWKLPEGSRPVSDRRVDATGDGLVSATDAGHVVLDWINTRETGSPCGSVNAGSDVNSDGCVDISDIQSVAANLGRRLFPRPFGPASSTSKSSTPSSGVNAAADPPMTFVVNTTRDDDDISYGDHICLTSRGQCTLRAAIVETNWHAGPDTVAFDIPAASTGCSTVAATNRLCTIPITSALPELHDSSGGTTIDGYTQPTAAANTDPLISNATLRIQITGPGENVTGANQFAALRIVSAGNVIRGLSLYRLWRKIWISGVSATGNRLIGDFIGTDAAGTYKAAQRVDSAYGGVEMDDYANANTIGGTDPADRNVISGNPGEGIHLRANINNNRFINIIGGLNPRGTAALPNWIHGLDINYGSSNNIVGGTGPGERNVFSGNARSGVEVSHGGNTLNNSVIGNYIGVLPDGNTTTAWSGDGNIGIHVEDGVGGTIVAYNVVGHCGYGQLSPGGSAGGISVNGLHGPGTTNPDGMRTRDSQIYGNKIGIGADGVTPAPNKLWGVEIRFHAITTTLGPNNVIAYNPVGVAVGQSTDGVGTDILQHRITGNSIFNNTGMGIDIYPTGPNPNDVGDADSGPNGMLNHPAITSATPTAITGSACAGCTVEVFSSDGLADVYGEGRTFLGTGSANSGGRFSIPLSAPSLGSAVTATATDADGNTSEFSLNQLVRDQATPPAGTAIATDSFTRTVSNGWATAALGGVYSREGNAPDFAVSGGAGTLTNAVAGTTRRISLLSLSQRDVSALVRVHSNKNPQGAADSIYVLGREVSSGNEYRARIRIATDGSVLAAATRVVNGTESFVPGGPEVLVGGLTYAAPADLMLRAEFVGVTPTVIRIKVWPAASSEPSAWAYTATDSTGVLQQPGGIGLQTYVPTAGTNAPVAFSFDDLSVTHAVPAAPIANFTSSQTPGTLDVHLTDTSSGGLAAAWAWDFGDGSTSSQQNPTHTFATGASYSVTLTASNAGGSSSITKSLNVVQPPPQPVANFTATQTAATLNVGFTDTSSGSPTAWAWDFGDGTTSSLQNPTHTFASAGDYTVQLTATNVSGSNTLTATVTVQPLPPVAGFDWAQTPNSHDADFTDTSTGGTPASWAWDFGDGSTSSEQNPTHTFAADGDYTVTLSVTNAGGSDSKTRTVSIVAPPPAPVADFGAAQTAGTRDVAFTDSSSGAPTSWSWDFGDGSTSTQQNPTHTFAAPGDYSVKLTASNLGGSDSKSRTITVLPLPPVANFTSNQAAGTLDVSFADTSTGGTPSAWTWDFGDGSGSSQQNPSHSYALPGDYPVKLTATNAGGTDSRTRTVSLASATYAVDAFGRSRTDSWGPADVGGPWTIASSAADFDVNGSVGTVVVPSAGATRSAYLSAISARDVDATFRVSIDKAAAGAPQYAYAIIRHRTGAEYLAKLRIAVGGGVYIQASRLNGSTETKFGSEVLVSGLSYAPGTYLHLRTRAVGASPTTIQIKVWADAVAEPASWNYTATDGDPGLQVGGSFGLRAYIGGVSTNAPVTFSFDDVQVTTPLP